MRGQEQFNQRKKFKACIVDDDDEDRFIFLDALKELRVDIEAMSFGNGNDALEHFEGPEALPDLLFLDMYMPVISGLEFLRKVRADQRYAEVFIVIFSNTRDMEIIEEAFILGANAYVRKPDKFEALKKMLNKIIAYKSQCLTYELKQEYCMLSLGV